MYRVSLSFLGLFSNVVLRSKSFHYAGLDAGSGGWDWWPCHWEEEGAVPATAGFRPYSREVCASQVSFIYWWLSWLSKHSEINVIPSVVIDNSQIEHYYCQELDRGWEWFWLVRVLWDWDPGAGGATQAGPAAACPRWKATDRRPRQVRISHFLSESLLLMLND